MMDKACCCPLCGEANLCQASADRCWCNDVNIPLQLIELIPQDQIGKSCLCRHCIEKFNSSPEHFLVEIKKK